ncbi:MAG: cytochrome P450, partial [Bdellovibrionota bacterium]
MTTTNTLKNLSSGKEPPKMPGALPVLGHMLEFGKNPFGYMMRLRNKLGEIGEFRMFHQKMVLMTGPEANEAFFRAPDAQLDQSQAYKIMTPIFGKGVVFDAPPHKKDQQLKMLMPVLRDKPMRGYAQVIVGEVVQMIADWGDSGEIDLLEFMKELTIYTSSHCLLGDEFRYELNEEFAKIYHDLEKGVNPLAFVFPYLPLPVFRRRDKARARLQELVTGIIAKRAQKPEKSEDAFQLLIDARYDDGSRLSAHEITGMLIGTIFAGHHTTAGTAA